MEWGRWGWRAFARAWRRKLGGDPLYGAEAQADAGAGPGRGSAEEGLLCHPPVPFLFLLLKETLKETFERSAQKRRAELQGHCAMLLFVVRPK